MLQRGGEAGLHTESRTLRLDAGFHDVRIDYQQHRGRYYLNVQWAPVGDRARPFNPEALFPSRPDERAFSIHQRLRVLRSFLPVVWTVPSLILLLVVSAPFLVWFGRWAVKARPGGIVAHWLADARFWTGSAGMARLDRLARRGCWLLPFVLLPLMVRLSFDFGATWDEEIQQEYGEAVAVYFTSSFSDRSSFTMGDLYLYGGMFDLLCVMAQEWFPGDEYEIRHVVNSLFGWLGILFCGMAANRAFGPRAGLLAMLLLALSPRYFGHAMNNPKDIPFAAMTAAALYLLTTVRGTFPCFWRAQALLVVVAVALAINVRAEGILYLCYAAVLIGLLTLVNRDFKIPHLLYSTAQLAVVAVARSRSGPASGRGRTRSHWSDHSRHWRSSPTFNGVVPCSIEGSTYLVASYPGTISSTTFSSLRRRWCWSARCSRSSSSPVRG